jgi:DNA excision repair protein ERCC-2
VILEDFFAYDAFRPGQRELAYSIYTACKNRRHLVAEAMSGFGKTAAVLSGSMAAADELGLRVIYACRTKREVLRAVEEISKLQKKRELRAANLFSKYDYCLLRKRSHRSVPPDSFKWYCGFNVSNNLCTYFLNLSLLGNELVKTVRQVASNTPTHAELLDLGEKFHVCPYEITRLTIPEAQIIVAPYHYVFDASSRSVLLTNTTFVPPKTILVLDEAHNLRDFMRSMSTFKLSVRDLRSAITESVTFGLEKTRGSLQELQNHVHGVITNSKSWYVNKQSFLESLVRDNGDTWLPNLAFELTTCAGVAWYSVSTVRALPVSTLRVGGFLTKLLSSMDDAQVVLTQSEEAISLTNMNPTSEFASTIQDYHNVILLSATMSPSDLFLRSIGMDPSSISTHTVQSLFPQVVRTILDHGVTTRFKLRNHEMYSKIREKLLAVASAVKGGVGVYFASYSVMDAVLSDVGDTLVERDVLCESPGLSNQGAEELMAAFRVAHRPILFAVQGGRFSEGEDFSGDLMDASVVVGLSLPPPSPTMYAEYIYLKRNGIRDSYLLLSMLPALRKAFQSAGRHLRTPDKKGLVFLLDSRFNTETVLNLMPSWLKQDLVKGDFTPNQIQDLVSVFGLA